MEQIRSFITDEQTKKLPFYVELTGITYPDPDYGIDREISDIYVLEYVMEGSGVVEIDSQVFYPAKGDVYLLPAGSRHRYYASKENPFQKIWMNVNGSLCKNLLDAYSLSGKYIFENADCYDLFTQFLSLCETETDTPIIDLFDKCGVIFMQIIQQLSRQCCLSPNHNSLAYSAKTFCDRNLYQKITLEDIAGHIGLSVSHLNRLFKKEFSITVYAYLLNARINTAKSLLKGTALPINEIAYMLKFADEHYFSNVFKEKTGMSPSRFRAG